MSSILQVKSILPMKLLLTLFMVDSIIFFPFYILMFIAGIQGKDSTFIPLSLAFIVSFFIVYGILLMVYEVTEFSDNGVKKYRKFFKWVGKETNYSYNDFDRIYVNFFKGAEIRLVKKGENQNGINEEYLSYTYSFVNFENLVIFLKDKLNPDCYHPSYFILYNKLNNPSRSIFDKFPRTQVIVWCFFLFCLYFSIIFIKDYLLK